MVLINKKQISFTIYGNEMGNNDNPLPKLKMTGKQHWMPKAQKYVRYKNHVVASLLNATEQHPVYSMLIRNIGLNKKPLNTKRDQKMVMDIIIHWKNYSHGDPENIFGAIADSIFADDKYLDGSFRSFMSKDGRARVDVVIYL